MTSKQWIAANPWRTAAAAAILLLAGGALGYWASGYRTARSQAPAATDAETSAMADSEREVLYWYDPMVPDQHFDKPGKSPFMDMMLVPRFTPESSPDCTIDDVEADAATPTPPREVGEGDEGTQP